MKPVERNPARQRMLKRPQYAGVASLARTTGAALVLSLVAAILIERDALTSVWCFFAAILSGLVVGAIMLEQRFATEPKLLPMAI
jgi:hypothetical protein